MTILKLKLMTAACVLSLCTLVAMCAAPGSPAYDALVAARRPLVIVNGVTQQLALTDYLSTVGGLTTNATAASAGDIQTTTATVSTTFKAAGQVQRTGVISPTLAASQDNYNPAGLATASTINAAASVNSVVTGLAAQATGTEILFRNASVYAITLAGLSGSSSSSNQFDFFEGSITLQPYQTILLRYTGSKWVGVAHGSGTSFALPNITASSVLTLGQIRPAVNNITTTGTQDDINVGNTTIVTYAGVGTATFTGFLGGTVGRPLIIQNLSGSALTLAHATGSAAGRQLTNPGGINVVLAPTTGVAAYVYETATGSWSLVFVSGTTNSVPTLFTSTKNKGSITLAAGTGTATVAAGSVCTCSDTTANASVQCAVSSTTLTATGTGTDVIAYLCF